MAKSLSAPEAPSKYKQPPPSVYFSWGKGEKFPDGFEDVDVGDGVTVILKGKVVSKTKNLDGGSINVEYKGLIFEPGKVKSMSLKDAMDKVMAKREL